MSEIAKKHCKEQTVRLSDSESAGALSQLPEWNIENGKLSRVYSFKNYYATIAFVNLVAWISHHENHHPDLHVGYNKCRVEYSTHSVGGLSENDFICAARIDVMLAL